jgi:hypothetical protein
VWPQHLFRPAELYDFVGGHGPFDKPEKAHELSVPTAGHTSADGLAMQPSSLSTPHPRPSPNATIPYSLAALRQDLDPGGGWRDCQASRDRNSMPTWPRSMVCVKSAGMVITIKEAVGTAAKGDNSLVTCPCAASRVSRPAEHQTEDRGRRLYPPKTVELKHAAAAHQAQIARP